MSTVRRKIVHQIRIHAMVVACIEADTVMQAKREARRLYKGQHGEATITTTEGVKTCKVKAGEPFLIFSEVRECEKE